MPGLLAGNERGCGVSSFGHERERKLKRILEDEGWIVVRAAGSLGIADLVALKLGHTPKLIEVKSDARHPFGHFGPEKRAALLEAAARAGASAWLVWWPKRKQPVWLAPSDWP